jgi:hypothetical protein
VENPSGKRERAERTEELKRLREGDADFLNGDVIQNVGERDADDGRDNENQVYVRGDVKRGADFSKDQSQRKQERGSDETDDTETADRTELCGWTFNEHAIERPAKDGDECDQQTAPGNMSILTIRLKPDHPEGAEQSEQRSELKLPLTNDVAFLRKKGEGEERGENYRCAPDDGVDSRPHVKQCGDLSDLVNDVGQTRNQAKTDGAEVDPGTAPKLKQDERDNGETGDSVTVKILRPGIVETVEVKQEKRRQRPDAHGGENRGVSSGKSAGASLHAAECGMTPPFRSLICSLARG